MLLAQSRQFDLRVGVVRLAARPVLQQRDRLGAPLFLDEEDRQGPLAGIVILVSGEAEVVVLLRRAPVTPLAEHLCLLVIGGAKVVEAVGAPRLPGKRLLEVVHRAEIVPLLIELDSLGVVVALQRPAAGQQHDHHREGGRCGAGRRRFERHDGHSDEDRGCAGRYRPTRSPTSPGGKPSLPHPPQSTHPHRAVVIRRGGRAGSRGSGPPREARCRSGTSARWPACSAPRPA